MIFGEDDPPASSGLSEPVFVFRIRRKVIVVDVEDGTGLTERGRDALLSQRPVKKEDEWFRRLRRRVHT